MYKETLNQPNCLLWGYNSQAIPRTPFFLRLLRSISSNLMPVHTVIFFSRHPGFFPISLDSFHQKNLINPMKAVASAHSCALWGKWWIRYLVVTNAFDPTKPKASGKQRLLSLFCNRAGLLARLSREEILHCSYHLYTNT